MTNYGWCCHHVWPSTPSLERSTGTIPQRHVPSLQFTRSESSTMYLPALPALLSSGLLVVDRRREGDVTMTKPWVGRGIGHHRAATLAPPRWLGVFAPVWWALREWFAGSPVGYGSVAGGPDPRVWVRGRSTAAGPGGGAAPWGVSVCHRLCSHPSSRRPAASVESREHSDPSAQPTRKRVVLLSRPRSSPLTLDPQSVADTVRAGYSGAKGCVENLAWPLQDRSLTA